MNRKTAYILTKATHNSIELTINKRILLDTYCKEKNLEIVADTIVTDPVTADIKTGILKQILDFRTEVIVVHSLREFGRDLVSAAPFLRLIIETGTEIHSLKEGSFNRTTFPILDVIETFAGGPERMKHEDADLDIH